MNSIKQELDQPLYGDIFWSRPQRRSGRVLVVGGHSQGFAEVQQTFAGFEAAGIAECALVMPNALQKLMPTDSTVQFVPSTPAGSIAKGGVAEVLELVRASDALCLGPDLSNNSETTLAMQRVIAESEQRLVVPSASFDVALPELARLPKSVLLMITPRQLLKLVSVFSLALEIPLSLSRQHVGELLQNVSRELHHHFVCIVDSWILVAINGELSLTALPKPAEASDYLTGLFATFWLQHSTQPFQALTSAAYVAAKTMGRAQTSANLPKQIRAILAEL